MHTIRGAQTTQSGRENDFALPPEDLRAFGHRLVDDFCDALGRLADEPVWQPMPAEVRARLSAPVPHAGLGLEGAYAAFARDVRPYRYGNIHPRFFGWVNGSGLPAGVFADFLASAMNSNVGGFDQSAVHVEEQVLGWLRGLFELPPAGDGVLTSGGSVANLLGLAAARHAHVPSAREHGLSGTRPLTLYGSVETHNSVAKAAELLGLGREHFRRIPVDAHFRIDLAALRAALAADRAAGLVPFALVANAGTVNTGAIDPLADLADLAQRENLWLHVDGAFGALAWLCPERRAELAGLPRADSLAFDLHKWMYLPSDIGCVLVRRPRGLEEAFAHDASYLSRLHGGLTAESGPSFKDRGIELTRRFRALKAWFALQVHGLAAFERAIRENLAQTTRLAELVRGDARLELLAPVPLNVVCFRYRGEGADEARLDRLNRELLVRLQAGGVAAPSHTVLGGRFALRCALTNHRTNEGDLVRLVEAVLALGSALERESLLPASPAL
jgi:glutamate/tyrosine decarboxylase-like PLP-dependent enzyme